MFTHLGKTCTQALHRVLRFPHIPPPRLVLTRTTVRFVSLAVVSPRPENLAKCKPEQHRLLRPRSSRRAPTSSLTLVRSSLALPPGSSHSQGDPGWAARTELSRTLRKPYCQCQLPTNCAVGPHAAAYVPPSLLSAGSLRTHQAAGEGSASGCGSVQSMCGIDFSDAREILLAVQRML